MNDKLSEKVIGLASKVYNQSEFEGQRKYG